MSPTDFVAVRAARTQRPPSAAPRAWAGSVLVLAGLMLMFFAGCFLIGVLGLLRPAVFVGAPNGVPAEPPALSGDERVLLYALYGLAVACVLGALLLLTLGVRAFWLILFRATFGADGHD